MMALNSLMPYAIAAAKVGTVLAALSVILCWALWVFYIAIMRLRDVRDRWGLYPAQKKLAYPTLAVGYALDMLARLLPFAVIMRRLPVIEWCEVKLLGREFRIPLIETVSALLEREATQGKGWRKARAHWWRERLLADFDMEGDHGEPGRE